MHRPLSSKQVSDEQMAAYQQQQQYIQQQQQQQMANGPWMGQSDPQYYQAISAPQMGAYTAPYSQGGGFYTVQNNGGMIIKKRPITANKRNLGGINYQFGPKKSIAQNKNPSSLDLEISRMRPKIINLERERLYDDNLRQKITSNFLKDENVKLKTKIQILESDLTKKEKLIDELLLN